MRILDHFGLGKHVPVALAKCQCIVVNELVLLRSRIFRPWLQMLLALGKTDLTLGHVWDTFDRDDAASLAQLADW